MESELNYSEAYKKLEALVAELEDGDIQLDKLTEKVKEANGLISICETKLRDIDTEVKEVMKSKVKKKKKAE